MNWNTTIGKSYLFGCCFLLFTSSFLWDIDSAPFGFQEHDIAINDFLIDNNLPTASVFAIQPSCTNDVVNSDGYLQLSEITNGDRINWSIGSTYTGDSDYANAIDVSAAAFPYTITTGLSNPSGSQDYTVRVFRDEPGCNSGCFTDIIVTMMEQDCTVGCNCEEKIYLNDLSAGGIVHKFDINSLDSTLSEIRRPWLSSSTIIGPHGLAVDLNGDLYIGQLESGVAGNLIGPIFKLNCDGDVIDNDALNLARFHYNFGADNGYLYMPSNEYDAIILYNQCTGNEVGRMDIDMGNDVFSWGFYMDDTHWYFPDRLSGNIYSGVLDITMYDLAGTNSGSALFTTQAGTMWGLALMGMTRDKVGNYYTVFNEVSGATTIPEIRKYNASGTLIATITDATNVTNSANGQSGFWGVRGIVYSEETNLLYVGSKDNCVTIFDTTLTEIPNLNLGNPGNGNPKGIAISEECCPINNNTTIDTTLCIASINDILFLQELVNCNGTVCDGTWEEGGSNSGLTYDACDNSIRITGLNACGTFTLESDGIGNNPQCGAFVITLNISVNVVTASVVAADQNHCAPADPTAFTVTTPATGGTLTYQWQSSSTDCNNGFANIENATSDTYDPPVGLMDTTYYRVIVNSANAGCALGNCADTSNCITVNVNPCDWGDLRDVSATTSANDYQTTRANNGPVHVIIPGLNLGSTVDGEADGQSSPDALGDDNDEDGLTMFSTLDISPGSTFRLPLSYTNTTEMTAYIEAWIDWNNDGDFDESGEMVFDVMDAGAGLYDRIEATPPIDAVTGEYLGVRIRISHQDNMTPYGKIESGEIEDYLIGLDCKTQICVPMNITIIKE